MHITILCVGRLREHYLEAAQAEYLKRLMPYTRLEITEVNDEPFAAGPGPGLVETVINKESERLLRRLPSGSYVIALDREGTMLSSQEFARMIADLGLQGKSKLCFVIGGSLGLSPVVLNRAQRCLSFSALTFPHQLIRIVLLEQIYRGFKIIRGEPYHY